MATEESLCFLIKLKLKTLHYSKSSLTAENFGIKNIPTTSRDNVGPNFHREKYFLILISYSFDYP